MKMAAPSAGNAAGSVCRRWEAADQGGFPRCPPRNSVEWAARGHEVAYPGYPGL
jgi:hypothetical protein